MFPHRPCRDGPITMFPSSSIVPDANGKDLSFTKQAPSCSAQHTTLSAERGHRDGSNCLPTKWPPVISYGVSLSCSGQSILTSDLCGCCMSVCFAAPPPSFSLSAGLILSNPHMRRFDPSSFSIFLRFYLVSPHCAAIAYSPHRVKCFWASHARAGRAGRSRL